MNATKESLIAEIEKRVSDKILEQSNADLLIKLIKNADSLDEAINIAALGTTYKRTGLHFDKRLEKMSDTIKYFKKNEKLSFHTDDNKPTHKLIIGDNYEALQNLLIQYRGKIDVIYIDPPYGKDSMGEFAKTNYQNAITRDNLLSMLYPRLVLAKQLLSDSGVIFCSIDDRNFSYVRCLFDEVFGENRFVCNYIWHKKTGASDAKGIAVITEYILVYCNNEDPSNWNDIFTQNYESFDTKRYRFTDEYKDERGNYYPDNLDRGGLNYSDSMNYGIECPDGKIAFPNGRTKYENDGWIWKWSKEKVKWGIENGFIEFRKSKDKPCGWSVCYKNYLYVDNENNPIKRSAPFKNLITGILNGEGTEDIKDIIGKNIFKNPKPIELISYLIKSVNKYSPIILDFFAGSGTTGHAVLDLNRSEAKEGDLLNDKTPEGNRTFILCQLNEKTDTTPNGIAYDVTTKRLKRIMTGECYDGSNNFEWIKKNKPYGGNLDVYEIVGVSNFEWTNGKTPFDVIDETLYGKEKFATIKEKIEWVCSNFDKTQKYLEQVKQED
ncbi:MAG: site-specific DNA-methyltransferase [Bacteroidales bacterium]|nr:site-specific DNA-methyltransferase [Bacteroidales bacterium]